MIFALLMSCIFSKQIGIHDINKIKRSHVDIYSGEVFGSGNIVNYKNSSYIITANHTVNIKTKVYINDLKLKESTVYRNKSSDIAVLKLDKKIKSIKYKSPKKIVVGDNVHYWCRPNAIPISYYKGVISRIEDDEIVIDGYAWMGCSGSVVFNDKSEVIGVIGGIL